MERRARSRAIVIGAGIGGLLATRVLSDHVDEVVVVERDQLRPGNDSRRGVPQARHAHVVLAAAHRRIAGWFPDIMEQLLSRGAMPGDVGDALWHQAGAFKLRAPVGTPGIWLSRPLLEDVIRSRVAYLPNVTIRSAASVDGVATGAGRVVGVVVDGETLPADLVVDCSGRNTTFPGRLAAQGFPEPSMSHVHVSLACGTRILTRRPDDIPAGYAVVAATPPHQNRSAILLPIEEDRWVLTLAGLHGDRPPTDDAGFLGFARSLPTGVIADLLERAEALSPVMTHRLASSQRRHFERSTSPPAGYVAVGDAVASFNPMHGQGMSSAALQAERLGSLLGRHAPGSGRLPRAYFREAARVVDTPWRLAAGADFLHPATVGHKPAGTGLLNRYLGLVQRATHVSTDVLAQMHRVHHMVAPPSSLMSPRMLLRVLGAAGRSPAPTVRVSGSPERPVAGSTRRRSAGRPLPAAYPWPGYGVDPEMARWETPQSTTPTLRRA